MWQFSMTRSAVVTPACVERVGRPDARVDEKGECAKNAGREDDLLASAVQHFAAVPRLRDHAYHPSACWCLLKQEPHDLGAEMQGEVGRPGGEPGTQLLCEEVTPHGTGIDA